MPRDTGLISRASHSSHRTSLLCRGRPDGIDRFDASGTEFVLGDFAKRVELWVRQDICGGFGIAERDEHLTGCNGAVAARLELDSAAARRDADLIAGGDAEAAQFGGGEGGHR